MKKVFIATLLVTLLIPHITSDKMEKFIEKEYQKFVAQTYGGFSYDWQVPRDDFEQSIDTRSAREISMVQVSAGPDLYQNY